MDIPGPGNDRSLTADEARAWELIEKDLRLRARRRHRIAGFVVRCARRPLVVAGLVLVALAGVVSGAALVPLEAALVVAGALAGLGLLAVAVGVVGGRRRDRPTGRRRTRRGWRRRRASDLGPTGPAGPELV